MGDGVGEGEEGRGGRGGWVRVVNGAASVWLFSEWNIWAVSRGEKGGGIGGRRTGSWGRGRTGSDQQWRRTVGDGRYGRHFDRGFEWVGKLGLWACGVKYTS